MVKFGRNRSRQQRELLDASMKSTKAFGCEIDCDRGKSLMLIEVKL